MGFRNVLAEPDKDSKNNHFFLTFNVEKFKDDCSLMSVGKYIIIDIKGLNFEDGWDKKCQTEQDYHIKK